jgi:hypothetical protein
MHYVARSRAMPQAQRQTQGDQGEDECDLSRGADCARDRDASLACIKNQEAPGLSASPVAVSG